MQEFDAINTSVNKSICPFARGEANRGAIVYLQAPSSMDERFYERVQGWVKSPEERKKSLIVTIPQMDGEEFTSQNRLEMRLGKFFQLIVAHMKVPDRSLLSTMFPLIIAECGSKFRESIEEINQLPSEVAISHRYELMAFALSPTYVETHPRFAPHHCIVFNDGEVFKSLAKNSLGPIRRKYEESLKGGPITENEREYVLGEGNNSTLFSEGGATNFFMCTSPENIRLVPNPND